MVKYSVVCDSSWCQFYDEGYYLKSTAQGVCSEHTDDTGHQASIIELEERCPHCNAVLVYNEKYRVWCCPARKFHYARAVDTVPEYRLT